MVNEFLSNLVNIFFILTGEKYKVELNRDNPLGMGGKLAETYANLIKSMWSGDNCSVSPREFKVMFIFTKLRKFIY